MPSTSPTQQNLPPVAQGGLGLLGAIGKYSPAIGLGMGAAGLLSSLWNKPKNMSNNFEFDLAKSTYDPTQYQTNPLLSKSIQNSFGLGSDFRGAYKDMMNPSGSYNRRMFQNLRQNVGDMRQQTIGNMNAATAARGMVGMGGAYDAITNRQAGDQYATGMQGIMNTSLGMAGQFGQMATQAYGQGGQFASGIDARNLQNTQFNASNALQNSQFNVQNENDYNQYLKTSAYNQQVQNQNATGSWANNMSNNLFNIGGAFLGMPKVG
tara:strand:- start:197 stop:991 length:795 start_codon:yes stop_codon:yes gene_type:complete